MKRSLQRAFEGKLNRRNFPSRSLTRPDFPRFSLCLFLISSLLLVSRSGAVGGEASYPKRWEVASMQDQTVGVPSQASKEELRLATIKAVKQGDVAAVRRLLGQGAGPNAREVLLVLPRADQDSRPQKASEEPLLTLAARQGNIEVVKLLLASGARVDAPGEAGFTPLMEAVRTRHLAIVTLLLNQGAKPDQRNDFGDTALLFIEGKEQEAMLQTLLKAGADIDGGTGWTPLMHAAYNGEENMVKLLLKKGAQVNIKRQNLLTPLECALVQGNDTIAALLKASGGKGRTLKQLEAEEAQESKKLAAEEKANQRAAALKYRKERILTGEDKQVIETTLRDLLTVPDDQFVFLRDRPDLLLVDQTAGGSGMIADTQINSELHAEQAMSITVEMRQHLQHRNYLSISLKDFRSSNAHIHVSKNGEGYDLRAFSKQHPTARGYIMIYLPGYSSNHEQAVLRFGIGPSDHGAAGTCFLVKEGGVWHVKWKQFSHFL